MHVRHISCDTKVSLTTINTSHIHMNISNFFSDKAFPLLLISGPCVIENYSITFEIASFLKELTQELGIPFLFKASYDKANRTSIDAYRGPGIGKGLDILARIKSELGIEMLSDVHRVSEIADAAAVLDVIQIPAFLCRQTDFILEVAKTEKPVNIKKGQFVAPYGHAKCRGKNSIDRQPADSVDRKGQHVRL